VQAKAFDKKTSVLQYLVKLVKNNEPDLLNVHEEMPSIGPAESVVVETLVSELKELKEQLQHVKATATAEGKRIRDGKRVGPALTALDRLRQQKTKIKDVEGVNMYNQTETIQLTIMEKFVLYAEKRTKEAFSRIEEVQENFKGVLTYFGENPTMTSSDFFGTMNKFVAAFDAALVVVKRIEALNAAEEKKAAAKRAKEGAESNKKNKIKEQAIKSLTAKIDRLTAEKEGKEAPKGPVNGTLKETVRNKNELRKEFAETGRSKGTLDLTGQRKQFADPFAGPEEEQDIEEPVTKQEQVDGGVKQASPLNNDSNGTLGFFPATSPNKTPVIGETVSQSPNDKKSVGFFPATSPRHTIAGSASFDKNKSETSPYRRTTFAGPQMSPFAKGIKHEQLTEQKLHLHHIEMPIFDDEKESSSSEDGNKGEPMSIAVMAAAAAQKKAEAKDTGNASKGEPMGIAAMAAAAAQKKAEAKDTGNASKGESMGIAAMAAAAVQKRAEAKDTGNQGKGEPMGIAAMAAAAAQKKAEAKDTGNASEGGPMGIAAMSTAEFNAASLTQDKQVATELLCSACNLPQAPSSFSKNQRSKGAKARCKQCIASAVEII